MNNTKWKEFINLTLFGTGSFFTLNGIELWYTQKELYEMVQNNEFYLFRCDEEKE